MTVHPLKRNLGKNPSQLLPAPYHCTQFQWKRQKYPQCIIFYITDFLIWNGLLIFISGFLYPEHKKLFWIYFSGMYYFLFQIFISGIKVSFGIFLNCVGCRLENVGCRKNLPKPYLSTHRQNMWAFIN